MKHLSHILAVVLTLAALSSCEWVSSFFHDDEVVAKLGARKLYRSELTAFIPRNTAPEDSAKLARQYILTWAKELLFVDVATLELSKTDSDVTRELEDYRRSLLKFRYEQQYIGDRLDTVVVREEIEDYYKAHPDLFSLQMPIVRARFVDIMKESPALDEIRKKMSSKDYEDLTVADSLAYSSALKYEDSSDEWVEMPAWARNFGCDYGTVLSRLRGDGYVVFDDAEQGDIKIGYVVELRKAGTLAPLDFCRERIRDIIISNRKHALLTSLEQDLLNDALDQEKLIIY